MENDRSERPPVFRRWRSWYALVLTFAAALILFFAFLTKYFS